MKNYIIILFFLFSGSLAVKTAAQTAYDYSILKRERHNRGVAVIRKNPKVNVISWRYLSSDPENVAFNIYRNGIKINKAPLMKSTYYEDTFSSDEPVTYKVKKIIDGRETYESRNSYVLPGDTCFGYIQIPLDIPPGGTTPTGQSYTYSANDASIGDVDGDGEYEIILKWDPSNAHDNSHRGYTGNVYIDCYKLNGTKLWRIDLGRNIRAGAHYTQFMVYDLDADGKAEIVMKTADATVDGTGKVVGDAKADFRNADGFILSGPEYLTVFEGETGKALETIEYIPPRGNDQKKVWGDERGNRVDRFLAAVAYLDGEYPSVVMCRGYYTRTVLAAYDWRNGKLTNRWVFDSDTPGNEKYAGQGNHNLRIGDVDSDGCDEIIYGSCAIDHNGKGLYSTGLGHGDAMHLTVFDPKRPGLQVWDCHENKKDGSTYRDAATGEILFQIPAPDDVGRCMAADIDPNHPGVEMWSISSSGIYNVKGECINPSLKGISINMACWWTGDLLRELLNKTEITKYNPKTGTTDEIFRAEGCVWNNGTKSNPCFQGDIIGDWREEVIFRTPDNKSLRIYVSDHKTDYRFHSFAEEPVYRISMATQNVAYNQPTQPGFYFGPELGNCFPEKNIEVKSDKLVLDAGMNYDSYRWSVGGHERTCELSTKNIPLNKKTKIELTVTFRGYSFTDFVYVTLKP